MSLQAIDRELQMIKNAASAPREARLGCVDVSHDRLGFCDACAPQGYEVACWRLLAMRDAATKPRTLADEVKAGLHDQPHP